MTADAIQGMIFNGSPVLTSALTDTHTHTRANTALRGRERESYTIVVGCLSDT